MGLAIQYYKYPLYEAFHEAYDMLFHRAKNNRNAAAISLQKHSGQAVTFVLEDFKQTNLTGKLQGLISKHLSDDMLQSIQSKIWEFKPLFHHALSIGGNTLKNGFDNTFDSTNHSVARSDIDLVRELLEALTVTNGADRLKELDNLLRFARFWGERGDDEDV